MFFKFFAVFVFFFFSCSCFGVISIDRNYIFHPLKSSLEIDEFGFLTFTSSSAEFGKYFPEPYTDFNHFWIAKAGVFGEFFRYKNSFSICLFSDIELIASSNSVIFFDPRAFYWQEGILFSYKYENLNFQFSFTHRCKHDIDNADFVSLYKEVRARVIIWDSLWVRFFTDPLILIDYSKITLKFIPFVRNDFYVLGVDEMVWYKVITNGILVFHNDSKYRVNKIVDSFSLGSIFDLEISKDFGFYLKGYWMFDFMGDDVIWKWSKIDEVFKEHYFEISFYVKGEGIRIFFFIQNNFSREVAIEPFDQGAVNLFHFGIRAVSEKFHL